MIGVSSGWWRFSMILETTNCCPPQERAASTTVSDKEGFVEATPSRVLRDGVGMSVFKLRHHPLFQVAFEATRV